MNRFAVIKDWAAFHVMAMMTKIKPQLQDEFNLHQYKLYCMCYILLCDDNFVKFDEDYGIIACTRHPHYPVFKQDHDQLYDLAADGYIYIYIY